MKKLNTYLHKEKPSHYIMCNIIENTDNKKQKTSQFIHDFRITKRAIHYIDINFNYYDYLFTPNHPQNKTLCIQNDKHQMAGQGLLEGVINYIQNNVVADLCKDKINILPTFVSKILLTRTLCRSCMSIDLIVSLFDYHKKTIREFFNTPYSDKNTLQESIQKLLQAKNIIKNTTINEKHIACKSCKTTAKKFNLTITSDINILQRTQNIDKLLKYLLSPTSQTQQIFFMLASSKLPQDVAKKIIEYL